jgi:hypothetical protein
VGHGRELAPDAFAQGVEGLDEGQLAADGVEVLHSLIGGHLLLDGGVGGVNHRHQHRRQGGDGGDRRGLERGDPRAAREQLVPQDGPLQDAGGLETEIELVELRLAVVLDDDEDGAVEGVDEVVERVVRTGHAALGLVRLDLEERAGRVGGKPLGLEGRELGV